MTWAIIFHLGTVVSSDILLKGVDLSRSSAQDLFCNYYKHVADAFEVHSFSCRNWGKTSYFFSMRTLDFKPLTITPSDFSACIRAPFF